jgi:carboxyl-terminal processing protease
VCSLTHHFGHAKMNPMQELFRAKRPTFLRSVSKKAFASFIGLVAVFTAGIYVGLNQTQSRAETSSNIGTTSVTLSLGGPAQPSNVDLSSLWQTWQLLNDNFVEAHGTSTPPTNAQKINGMISGLVNSYGDPYTTYFPPSDAKLFDQNISGSFSGVGMEMGADKDGQIIVIAPLKGSPSEAAGIKSGDHIIAIDGTSTEQMSSDDAVKLIRGPQGTTVKLTLVRAGVPQPFVIAVVRDNIQIPTLDYTNHANTGIFEIDLYNFGATADDQFREALRAFVQSGDHKLVLDMRGNPGGYLDAAADMASFFLPAGDTIVTEDYKGKQQNNVHRSYGYNVFAGKNLKMAIIMDQGTASAAEILSGALEQHGVAVLVGTRSFGKGSVQELFNLGGGAQVKITVARWLTPNGTNISDGGLKPDIAATTTQDDISAGRDPQKDAAMQYLETH